MDTSVQAAKAEALRALHHRDNMLVLPNIWDPLGGLMLQSLGFPAVATASAAVAFSLGYDDGELMSFDTMIGVIGRIAKAVSVPLSADVERGYAVAPDDVAANVRHVIEAGAVGINIEDSTEEGGALFSTGEQCARIQAVRDMASSLGVPLFINARMDTFLSDVAGSHDGNTAETIERAKAYLQAGADGIYPIGAGDVETLRVIYDAVQAPINVYGSASTAPMRDLEAVGVRRLSIGPWLLKASLTAMRDVAESLKNYGSYDVFTEGVMSSDDVRQYLSGDPTLRRKS